MVMNLGISSNFVKWRDSHVEFRANTNVMRNFYDIVGVSDSAPLSAVKQAYFDFLRSAHPDKVDSKQAQPQLINTLALIWNRIKVIVFGKLWDLFLTSILQYSVISISGTIV